MATYKNIRYNTPIGGGGSAVLLSEITASSDSTISFTTGIDSTYKTYLFKCVKIHPSADGYSFDFQANVDGASGSIILNGTDGSSSNAGDNVILDSSAAGGADSESNITLESGTSAYSVLDTPTKNDLVGGTDDYSVSAGELKTGYGKF